MDFNHFSISDVGRHRQANEDNCGDRMTANGYVFVVCDGMGGHVGGATASRIAVDSILNFLENPVQNIYVGINDAFQFANSQILEAVSKEPELKGMGTTGTILVINNDACYIGHVGDSRIYLKSDDKLNRLTKDHSFVQTLVDQGIITDDQAESHPKKNQILEALGIKPNVNPTVCEAPIQAKPGDCFLLCSDGLNGMINDTEIERLIDPSSLEASCGALIDAANYAGGKDNITATLVTITESPFGASVFKHFNPVNVGATTIIERFPDSSDGGDSNGKGRLWMWLSIGVGGLGLLALVWFFFLKSPNENVVKPPTPGKDSTEVKKDSLEKEDVPENKVVNNKVSGNDTQKREEKAEEKEEEQEVEEKEQEEKEETKPDETETKPTSHLVEKGDSLSAIAEKYGVSEDAIITANTGDNSSLSAENQAKLKDKKLDTGWKLIIPAK